MGGEERFKNTRRLPEKNNVTLILFQLKKKKGDTAVGQY